MKKILILFLVIIIFTSGCAFRNTRFRDADMIGIYISLDNEEVILNLCGCGRATIAKPHEVMWFDNWDTAKPTGTMRLDIIKDKKQIEPVIVGYSFNDNILSLTWLSDENDNNIFYMISNHVTEGDEFRFQKVGSNQHRIMQCAQ